MTLTVAARTALALALISASSGCTADTGKGPPSAEPAAAPPGGSAAARADALLREAAGRGFGGAVVVERAGHTLLAEGYGWAHRADEVPFTTDTVAQVGSLTKQFTAAAILALREDGRVDLQAPLSAYLSDLEPPASERTLHELLTHTAGFPEYCGRDLTPRTREEFLRICLAPDRIGEAGTFAYSNVGYGALGVVVEVVAGMSLDDFLDRRLFRPLGMERTGYRFPDLDAGRMAHGYPEGAEGATPPISEALERLDGAAWNLLGNGGMQSSATEMARWHRALREAEKVVTPRMRDALFRPHVHREGEVHHGYGWFVRVDPDGSVRQISHSGSDGTFFSYALWRPDEELFLYFVGNGGEERSLEVLRDVRAAFLP